jgi:monothiol glutaredoxin
MKGTSTMPQCGFSSKVSSILNFINVSYNDINVLEDEELRDGIKSFSDWPTIPQLYVNFGWSVYLKDLILLELK